MRIWLDPDKLKAYGLTVLDVQRAIQAQNIQVASGQIGGPPTPRNQIFQFTVNTLGRLSRVAQFENIIVKSQPPPNLATSDAGAPRWARETAAMVRIRDIAKVELSQQVFTVFSVLNGKKAAHIAVYALPGANALAGGDRNPRADGADGAQVSRRASSTRPCTTRPCSSTSRSTRFTRR